MNRKCFAVLVILIGIEMTCAGQDKKIQTKSINSVGLAEAQYGSAVQLQTINGIKKKSWFMGIGLGLDHYKLQSIPLFVDLRRTFGKKSNKIFIYANAGINFSDLTNDQKGNTYPANSRFKNGFYAETGAGYDIKLTSRFSLSIASGYTYKNTPEQYRLFGFFPLRIGGTLGNPTIKNEMNMILLKTAIEF
jgi:hypothetical protein